jgi:cell division protein ZapA (FtsZ GTPase activity inhibitor)
VSAVSIKVTIAGRTYPLTIDVSEELAVKNAAESINASIKNLQENYAVKDMLDLLAMSALQLLVENNGATAPAAVDNSELERTFKVELEKIESELSAIIQS